MGIEIEKKFLLKGNEWRKNVTSTHYSQGYIGSGAGNTVRVRIAGDNSYITIKGRNDGISRLEFEYSIPLEDARILLREVCDQPIIQKQRFLVNHDGFLWEIDEFHGENTGLILAEIELTREDQPFSRPPWLGREVSHLDRYYNARLRTYPFSQWKDSEKNIS